MRRIDSDVVIWNWRSQEGAATLLAATAIEHKLAIVTSNAKHFRSVKMLKIEAFKPR